MALQQDKARKWLKRRQFLRLILIGVGGYWASDPFHLDIFLLLLGGMVLLSGLVGRIRLTRFALAFGQRRKCFLGFLKLSAPVRSVGANAQRGRTSDKYFVIEVYARYLCWQFCFIDIPFVGWN